jgi:rhodanese-related sulfurtransferase
MSAPSPEIRTSKRGFGLIVALLVAVGGAIPLIVYECYFGKLPTVTPQEAKTMLRDEERDKNEQAVLLVDVRPQDVFAARHVDGAVNWPLAEILAVKKADEIPSVFREKTLLLLCNVGWTSRQAVEHLRAIGHTAVYQIRGGVQEWIHAFTAERSEFESPADAADPWNAKIIAPKGGLYDRFRVPDGVEELPFRVSPVGEQAAAVIAFFFFKPIYELLSLMIIVLLWKSREVDLTALRWGMIFFFLGENACALNYFAFRENSYLAEYLHGYGMMLCFAFTAYALIEGLDRRLLFFSDPQKRCAATALCGRCSKFGEAPCRFVQVFRAITGGLMIVSLMLITAGWQTTAYNTVVFRQLYNYAHLWIYQLNENVYCGTAASAMFGISLLLLCVKKENAVAWAKIAFAAGIGAFGFGFLRMILGAAYDQNRVWFLFWEETTELLFIIFLCMTLCIFRDGLLPRKGISLSS